MNYSNYRITLDIRKTVASVPLTAKKGDAGRMIHITLSDQGSPCQIADGCYAVFAGRKPDGTLLYNKTTIEDNTIIYAMTQQTTAVAGLVACEVKLFDSMSNLLTSPKLNILVDDVVVPDEEIVSKDEVTALAELILDATATIELGKQTSEAVNTATAAANEAAHKANAATTVANEAAAAANKATSEADSATKELLAAKENGEFDGPQGIPGERGEPGLTTYIAMIEEQDLAFAERNGLNCAPALYADFSLVRGENYVVIFDGKEYVSKCTQLLHTSGEIFFDHALGFPEWLYSEDYEPADGEYFPFFIAVEDGQVAIIANDEESSHRVGIYRFVRVPDDLLPEVDETYNGKILFVDGGKWKPSDVIVQIQQDIADLKYVPIDITNISNNSGTKEMGSVVNEVTVSWTLNKAPSSQTLDGEAVSVSARSKTFTCLSLSTNKTFTVEVTDERGATDSASTAISFINGVYHGVLESGAELDSAAILTLTRKLQGSKGITFTADAGATQQIVYAIPTRYGTPNFNVGGFDGGFAKAKTFDFTNASGYTESYDVWLSENVGLGSTTVTVS